MSERRAGPIARALDRIDATLWSRGLRHWRRPDLVSKTRSGPPLLDREREPFDYARVQASYQHPVTIEDRLYNYVYYPGTGDTLCIHFSAFFGEWGERRPYRGQFRGYFHRLRMFWPLVDHSFLFLCDTFGAEENGCYYKGLDGDFFVERAMDAIIADVVARNGIATERVVTMGSSMGATGALRFGLRNPFAGILAVCPHIDLDLAAVHQGRRPHVAAIVGRDDVEAPELYPITREIRVLAGVADPLPRLAIQSMLDDKGVHDEQVVPLVELWKGRGGVVEADYHATGGHTSEHATLEYFKREIGWCLGG